MEPIDVTPTQIVQSRQASLAVVNATPLERLISMVESGRDPASLDKLIDAAERMQKIVARQAFNRAMAAFKAECPPIIKASANAQFKRVNRQGVTVASSYADLADIDAAIRDTMSRNGLSYRWGNAVIGDSGVTVVCYVTHADGYETDGSAVTVPVAAGAGLEKAKAASAQVVGSAMTYAQRYSLIAALGLTTCDVDDDAAMASAESDSERITDDQARDLNDLILSTGTDKARFLKWAGAASLDEILATKLGPAMEMLLAKQKGAGK